MTSLKMMSKNKKTAYRKAVNGLGNIFKTLQAVLFASANCPAHKVRRR